MTSTLNGPRYSVIVSELAAIASDELRLELDAIRNDTLSHELRATLAAYLHAELQAYGMLSKEHLNLSGITPAEARTINRQARSLLAQVSA